MLTGGAHDVPLALIWLVVFSVGKLESGILKGVS